MWKQIRLLTKIQLLSSFGFNESRHSRDSKKKYKFAKFAIAYGILAALVMFYVGSITFGFVYLNVPEVVPLCVSVISALIILFFTIFKAGGTIFDVNSYENMAVLPVKTPVIIISKFATMYAFNLAFALLVFIPATAVYGFLIKPDIVFYLMMLLGAFILPFIPMSVATAIGAVVYAISSRLKSKRVLSLTIYAVLTFGFMGVYFYFVTGAKTSNPTELAEMSRGILEMIGGYYPPATLFSNGVIYGNILQYIALILISAALFVVLIWVVNLKYATICNTLAGHETKGDFVMGRQEQNSLFKSLLGREFKRYFSSNIYVMNTAIGAVLVLVLAVAILVLGTDKVAQFTGIGDIIIISLPLIMGAMFAISPTTAATISIEGKQWWVLKSLPLTSGTILRAKMVLNLIVMFPAYFVSEAVLIIAIRPEAGELAWLIIIPALYILLSTVLGLKINLKSPVFDWENETTAIKQGVSVLGCTLIAIVSMVVTMIPLVLLPGLWQDVVRGVLSAALIISTVIIYKQINKTNLIQIN